MNAVVIPATPGRRTADVPQLRTLLLTDLCDSTGLVERLGDGVAAELFRQHDLLVLQLQQQWRGRLIDRSDGMLLLFERPIDGLGFALDYTRGLRQLGKPHGVDLKARAGLHVGEVLTWRNSDEAVKVGAKPLEVEGLAKPMAARLMTLARPGQILVSAVAEPLAHRSARELGERGQHLLWKSHGRWRFKGVPTPQEIFEVGEAGIAPLRAPKPSPKASRDIPLWRRPAALVAEVAIVLGLGLGIWFVTRPQPAIAFNQRDWVVVADLRNLTGQPVLDDSLEQAFRISLEQSRYVNVLSDLKARQTLTRMRLPPETELDRAIASEIAIRDGARAVILPTVAEVGGHVRVSAEVIDPHSQTTVYSEYADGRGAQSALASIDDVTAGLRERLGEAMETIEEHSQPLPKVATGNLEALKAYALGNDALSKSEWKEALALYDRAIVLDPDFALAHLAIARVHVALSNRPAAKPHLARAVELEDGLPPRDRLYLNAWQAELLQPSKALAGWKMLAKMYPDHYAGAQNVAVHLATANDFTGALQYAATANTPQAPLRGYTLDLIGRAQLALGRMESAQASFEAANAAIPGVSTRRVAVVQALRGDHQGATATIEGMATSGYSSDDPIRYISLVSFAVDQARFDVAQASIGEAVELSSESDFLSLEFSLIAASVGLLSDPDETTVKACATLAEKALKALKDPGNAKAADYAYMALYAAYLAQRGGDQTTGRKVLAQLQPMADRFTGTAAEKMLTVVRAGQARLAGHPREAINILEPQLDGTELLQARVAIRDAALATGDHDDVLRHAEWLSDHRGLAYMESNAAQVAQSLNVMDTRLALLYAAEALSLLDRDEAARQQAEAFLSVWPKDRLPTYLVRRVEAILPASKQKTT